MKKSTKKPNTPRRKPYPGKGVDNPNSSVMFRNLAVYDKAQYSTGLSGWFDPGNKKKSRTTKKSK